MIIIIGVNKNQTAPHNTFVIKSSLYTLTNNKCNKKTMKIDKSENLIKVKIKEKGNRSKKIINKRYITSPRCLFT